MRHVLRAIKRCIEDAPFTCCPSLNDDLRERSLPGGLCLPAHLVEGACARFAQEVQTCLFSADKGESNLHLNDMVLSRVKLSEDADALFFSRHRSPVRL